jgi:hypothetical protein
MTPEQVTGHYGNQQLTAGALGCNQSTVSDWVRAGVIPDARQLQIERLTKKKLRADPGCLDRVLGLDKLKQPVATEQQGA